MILDGVRSTCNIFEGAGACWLLIFIDVRDLAPPYCIYAPHPMYYAAFKDIYNTCVLYLGISHTFW